MLDQSIIGIRPYVEDLVDLDEAALRNGWRTVRRTHKVERWPTISAILEASTKHSFQGSGGPRSERKRWRPASPDEMEVQRRAYGSVHMSVVTDEVAAFHRRQMQGKEEGRLRGPMQLNPFSVNRLGLVS